jgi:hypothetical protein
MLSSRVHSHPASLHSSPYRYHAVLGTKRSKKRTVKVPDNAQLTIIPVSPWSR